MWSSITYLKNIGVMKGEKFNSLTAMVVIVNSKISLGFGTSLYHIINGNKFCRNFCNQIELSYKSI